MVINTNIQAQAASSNLQTSQAMLSKSLSRLSSGSKIVNPADDAAGLAVSSRLDAQISRLDAAKSQVRGGGAPPTVGTRIRAPPTPPTPTPACHCDQ